MAEALIIHGNPAQAAALARALQSAGVCTEIAADAESARVKIEARAPDRKRQLSIS